MQSESLLSLLKYNGALLEGHFLLTSGKHSNLYIEKFRILENPQSLDKVWREAEYINNPNRMSLADKSNTSTFPVWFAFLYIKFNFHLVLSFRMFRILIVNFSVRIPY